MGGYALDVRALRVRLLAHNTARGLFKRAADARDARADATHTAGVENLLGDVHSALAVCGRVQTFADDVYKTTR